MHIENNVFDNISNTVMNVEGKIKNNMKAIMDLTLYYDFWNIELFNNRLCITKPKPHLPYIRMHCFLFMNNLRVCDFLMNVLRHNKMVNLEKYILSEIKSHNFHVFMQTLIPIAYRDLLQKNIWNVLRFFIADIVKVFLFNKSYLVGHVN